MEKEVYRQSVCLINEILELYYLLGMNQEEVSDALHISKATVSRLLKKGEVAGMIHHQIQQPYLDCLKLQRDLLRQYPIENIYVVPVIKEKENSLEAKKAVALEGARHLQRILSGNQMVGLSWGGTMHYMIQCLNPCQKKNTHILTMHGDISECGEEYNVNNLVRRAAMAFSGKRYILGRSGYCESEEELEEIKESDRWREFSHYFEETTISVAGGGCWKYVDTSPLHPAMSSYLSRKDYKELKENGVTSDFLLHFLDDEGREIDSDIAKRTLSIDLNVYRRIPYKIVMLSGIEKVYAARALLQGDYVDVLFLDYQLAKKLYFL